MARTASIGIRVEPEIKEAAERAARADRRTLAAWIEKLVVERLQEEGSLKADVHPAPAAEKGRSRP